MSSNRAGGDPLRILVVGGAGGIGAACVKALLELDHRVVAVDLDVGVDVTRPGGAEAAVELGVRELDGLDAIVHTVGMSGRRFGDGPVTTCTDEGWAEVLRVNLESAFRVLRSGLPAVNDGGSVVVVGSVLARSTDRDFLTAAYAASKGGLLSLCRTAAREVAPRRVRVNVVAPGLVDTPMAARALHEDDALRRRLPELQPLGGEPVTADEVAGAVTWLLSPGASATTGSEIVVDRGWTLR
jgi:NAD(P)-dependent dehydrogenase (short-subunit alcohol dehydrogenase family)